MKRGYLWSLVTGLALSFVGCGDDDFSAMEMETDAGTGFPADAGVMPEPDAGASGDAEADPGHTGEITLGRLVVADSVAAELAVFDLDDAAPAALDRLPLEAAAARVYGAKHGRYIYAVNREAGVVQTFDSGLLFQSHVDHYHISKRAPLALDLEMTGGQPTHWVHHDGWVAVFYDGSGDVDIIQERTISAGVPVVQTASTGMAHHGVAVVTHGHLLATVPMMDEVLPVGVDVRTVSEPDTVEMSSEECPALHGEASAGDWTVFGCGDGVLAFEYDNGDFTATKIPNPVDTPEEIRVGTVAAHEGAPYFVGNYGSMGLVLIDPAAETMEVIATEAQVGSFTFDLAGNEILAWTVDGMLHRFESTTGDAIGEPLSVTDEYMLVRGSARPSITAGGGRIYVLDPEEARVREVSLANWEVERDIATGGSPFTMALVSLSPDYEVNGPAQPQ